MPKNKKKTVKKQPVQQKPCDSCRLQLKQKLGRQSITFKPGEKSIYTKVQEWIDEEFSSRQTSQLITSDQGL